MASLYEGRGRIAHTAIALILISDEHHICPAGRRLLEHPLPVPCGAKGLYVISGRQANARRRQTTYQLLVRGGRWQLRRICGHPDMTSAVSTVGPIETRETANCPLDNEHCKILNRVTIARSGRAQNTEGVALAHSNRSDLTSHLERCNLAMDLTCNMAFRGRS
jgi:hypothetical protein